MNAYIVKQVATASLFPTYSAPAEDRSAFATLIATLVDESSDKFITINNGDLVSNVYGDDVRAIPLSILKEVVVNFNYSVTVDFKELASEPFVVCEVKVFEPDPSTEAKLQINTYSAECFDSSSLIWFDDCTLDLVNSIIDDIIEQKMSDGYEYCEVFLDKDLDIYVSVDFSDTFIED